MTSEEKSNSEKNIVPIDRDDVFQAADILAYSLEICCTKNKKKILEYLEDWQVTQKLWQSLHPADEAVPYPLSSMYIYTICTSLLHAIITKNLIQSLRFQIVNLKKILVLCGGSGAEIIACF